MLTVTKLTGSPGDILAYAQGRKDRSARGDYYLDRDGRDHELARVTWSPVMAGNDVIGLNSRIDPAIFEAVMSGRDPRTGDQVVTGNDAKLRRDLADIPTRNAAYDRAAELGVTRTRRRALTWEEAASLTAATSRGEADRALRLAGHRRASDQRSSTSSTAGRVAGHDLTFSAPKSISLAWALTTEPELRTAIESAHVTAARRSVTELQSRSLVGRAVVNGKRTRVPLQWVGIEAVHTTARISEEAAREGRPPDPDLHTHTVVANMGWDPAAQRWRAVDAGTLLHMRSLGDGVYLTTLADELRRLGFEIRPNTGRDGRYVELAGIEPAWIDAFSARAHEVRRAREILGIESDVPARSLAAATRRGKGEEAHQDHTAAWRDHLDHQFGTAAVGDLDLALSDRRPRERPTLERREAELLTRFFGPEGLCAHEATHTAVAVEATLWHLNGGRLTTAEMVDLVPRALRDSRLVLLDDDRYTTSDLLRQEVVVERAGRWLLTTPDAGRLADPGRVAAAIASVEGQEGIVLDPEQRRAVTVLTDPGHRLSLMGGRAGTGKTMTIRAAREVWEGQDREVVVLSVAAATAQRSAREIGSAPGMTFEAFAARRRSGLLEDADTRRLVVVVDEAAMADTPRLASLLTHIGDGTVVGLGDERQLQAVGAGGGWLGLKRQAQEAGSYVELTRVYRQRHEWERKALDDIRQGRGVEAIATYRVHDRIRITETRADARREVAEAWDRARLAGAAQGRPISDFVMVAATREDVAVLNGWAQGLRLRAGELGQGIELPDRNGGTTIHERDRVHLEGPLDVGHPNGLRGWIVSAGDGGLRIAWDDDRHPETLYRPVEHRDDQLLHLDYAATTQRTQGATGEEAFVLPSPAQGLENLYSALSRARETTTVWLDQRTWGQHLSELQPVDRRVIHETEVLARLAVRATEAERKTAALDVALEPTGPRTHSDGRLEAARRKLDAYLRANVAMTSRSAGAEGEPTQKRPPMEVDAGAGPPSLRELHEKLDRFRAANPVERHSAVDLSPPTPQLRFRYIADDEDRRATPLPPGR
ncbi:MAG: MobF family relaxase [Candidatus Dormibacteria bacterium]